MKRKGEEVEQIVACSKRKKSDGESDLFYTSRDVVKKCVKHIKKVCKKRKIRIKSVVDFSAGDGFFAEQFGCRDKRSYDLIPRADSVEQRNWFDVEPRDVTVVGFNPPFGYQANIVKRFLDHAAKFNPDVIAVVHPFTRKHIFPPDYKVEKQETLENGSFFNPDNNRPFDVPNCRFTILVRRGADEVEEREEEKEVDVPGFTPVSRDKMWKDYFVRGIAVRRTGVNSGRQVVVWSDGKGQKINQHGNLVPWSINDASSKAFHTFVTDGKPSIQYAAELWKHMQEKLKTREQGIVPTVNRAFVTTCMSEIK